MTPNVSLKIFFFFFMSIAAVYLSCCGNAGSRGDASEFTCNTCQNVPPAAKVTDGANVVRDRVSLPTVEYNIAGFTPIEKVSFTIKDSLGTIVRSEGYWGTSNQPTFTPQPAATDTLTSLMNRLFIKCSVPVYKNQSLLEDDDVIYSESYHISVKVTIDGVTQVNRIYDFSKSDLNKAAYSPEMLKLKAIISSYFNLESAVARHY